MTSYLITDPAYYGNNAATFQSTIKHSILKHNPSFACYRDKNGGLDPALTFLFTSICHDNGIKSVIHSDIKLALLSGANAVHLDGSRHELISTAKNLNLQVIASCHTQTQVEQCLCDGCDLVTLGPIFETPNKTRLFSIQEFAQICEKYPEKILALGGIVSKEHILQIEQTKAAGFASIRYFI